MAVGHGKDDIRREGNKFYIEEGSKEESTEKKQHRRESSTV